MGEDDIELLRRIADQLRSIADSVSVLRSQGEHHHALLDASESLEAVRAGLAAVSGDDPASVRSRTSARFREGDGAPVDRLRAGDAIHPMYGGYGPAYPPINWSGEGRMIEATVVYGPAYEGPPDHVHGGFVAAGFDMALSALGHREAGWGVTRRLSVRFLRPVPIGVAVRYEVGVDHVVGRLLVASGRLVNPRGDRLLATCAAEFVEVDAGRLGRTQKPSV